MTELEVIAHISNLSGDYKCWDKHISHEEALLLDKMLTELQQRRCSDKIFIEQMKELYESRKNNPLPEMGDIIYEVCKGPDDEYLISPFKVQAITYTESGFYSCKATPVNRPEASRVFLKKHFGNKVFSKKDLAEEKANSLTQQNTNPLKM